MSHLEHDTLWALSRSELTAAEAQAAKAHLTQCAECRVSFEDVQLAQSVLSVLPEAPPMPEQMARRVGASLAEAADAQAARNFTSWWQSLFTPRFLFAAALATVLVIAGAWMLASVNAPEPSSPIATPTPALTPSPLPAPQVNPRPAARKLTATVASAKKSTASKSQVLAEGSTVSTQSGGSVWMKLPDGSRAGLTAASEVKLATLEEKQLTLELNKGSLAMVVPHRLDRVVTVRAGDLEVKDLGTRFLVSRDQHRTLVAVEEGKVEVKTPNGTREVTANHAVTWSGGQLVELPWEASAPAAPLPMAVALDAPQPEVVPEGQPNSIARLSDEEEEDDTSPPPPEEVQDEPELLQPDRTPMAADEQWEGLPPNTPRPQPLGYTPPVVPPRRAVTATERGFSLKNLERKLREVGSAITSSSQREAGVRNIAKAADAGDCLFALQLADRWLSEPVTRSLSEPTLRRNVRLQQVRCLNHLGRKDDAAALLKMIDAQR